MSKFVTIKELKRWRDVSYWPDQDWPSRVLDTFVEMERLLIMAEDSRRFFAGDIKRLLEQIEPEDDS